MKSLIVVLVIVLLLASACRPVQRLPEAAGGQTPEAILQQIMALDPQAPDYAERMVATYAPDGDLTLIFSPGNENYLRGPDVLLSHYRVTGAENFRMQPGDVTVAGNTITSRGPTEMAGVPPFPTELVLELENGLVKHATWRVLPPEGGAAAAATDAAPAAVPDRTPRAAVEEFARLSQPWQAANAAEVAALFAEDASITRHSAAGGEQVIRGRGAIRDYREALGGAGVYSQFEILGEEGDTVTTHAKVWMGAGDSTADNPPQTPPAIEATVVFTVRDGLIQGYVQTAD